MFKLHRGRVQEKPFQTQCSAGLSIGFEIPIDSVTQHVMKS